MALPHKAIVFPQLAVTNDDGDAGWDSGEFQEVPGHEGVRPYYRQPGAYAKAADAIRETWERTVAEYEANPAGFCESYYYLDGHPAFWRFLEDCGDLPPAHVTGLVAEDGLRAEGRHPATGGLRACVDIRVVRVCPATDEVESDAALNTETRVWYELGKHGWPPDAGVWHDWRLDGGAATFEGAIVEAARQVWTAYGNDRRVVDQLAYDPGDAVPVAEA